MKIEERNNRVLQAVIDSYIESGQPIGSNVLAKRYDFGVSSATLRNIMAELEELGFLTHPHTSAGRVPTDQGYRFYIDSLINFGEQEGSQDEIVEVPSLVGKNTSEIMGEASRFLATLSRCAAVVIAPNETVEAYRHIEFVRLRGGQVLVIFVTESGMVQNKIITFDEAVRQQDLNRFSTFLDDELPQHSLGDIRTALVDKMNEEKRIFGELMEKTWQASREVEEQVVDRVYLEGATQMLDAPEFASVERMKQLFKAFEDKYRLIKLLDKSIAAQGIKVFIGAENPYFEMQGCSMVVSGYGAGGRVLGTLGVIGPTRMQYKQVIHVVNYTSRMLSRVLDERLQRGIER